MNKYPQGPDLLVLIEDDANRQMVNGFIQYLEVKPRAIQPLPIAGGWKKVLEKFEKQYIAQLSKPELLERRMVLLIDFDQKVEQRLSDVKSKIPDDLRERVFVLGVLSKPEDLQTALNHKSREKIGEALAQECADNKNELWGHELLEHNQPELKRMISSVKPFLFRDQTGKELRPLTELSESKCIASNSAE